MALTQIKTDAISDDAVTLAKQAAGTDGQIITYDASGNPTAVGPGTDGQVLTSTGAGSPPAFEAIPAGVGGATGVDFDDNAKIRLGTGNDTHLYHNGSHTYISHRGTGSLILEPKEGENGITLEADGAAKLYYNNTERLASSATGVTIAGDLNLGDSNIIEVGASNDLQIWHDGSNSYIKNSTNALTIQGGVVAINDVANAKTSLSCDTDGQVSLYNDNTLVAGTRADGWEVRAASSQSAIIQIMANNAGSADDYWRIIADTGGDLQLWNYAGSSWTKRTNWTSSGRLSNPETYSAAGSSMRDVQVESNGNFCGQSSIRAAKKNITELTDVSWIYNLKPVSFNYRKRTDNADGTITWLEDIESEKAHGLIAEEVEAVNKDFVYYNKDKDDKDVLAGVYYKPLISPLIKAVKDLKAEVDTLKAKVAALESA